MLKQCLQSNRYARQSGENLPKVCPRKRRFLHFDYGKLSICANRPFYFIGSAFCWTIYQTKERVKFDGFFKICIIYKNIGVFYMTALVREGYPSEDIWRNFRSFFEHSDCSRRTVWAPRASLRQEQSISGAEKARKSTCLRWDIPLGWKAVTKKLRK